MIMIGSYGQMRDLFIDSNIYQVYICCKKVWFDI